MSNGRLCLPDRKNMATASELTARYFEVFDKLQKHATGREPAWLQRLRQNAQARFSEVGFPTIRDEDWRFTNVAPIARTTFRMAAIDHAAISSGGIEPYAAAKSVCLLVFINGYFSPEHSRIEGLPAGLEVHHLSELVARDPQRVERHLGSYADMQRDPFTALNTALWKDGAFIHVRRRAIIEEPIHLLYVSTNSGEPLMVHPRTLIVAEPESQAAVMETYISTGESAAFCNSVTELVAAEGANIAHCMVEQENRQSYNVSTLRIQQGRDAHVASHSLLLGGALVRNNVHPVLAGEGAECLINGLFIGGGRQHLDNFMLVEHASPNGSSRQFYNGILDDKSRGVFHGRIIVHKDAQKTDAKQTNRNLLLSDDARIDTKPQLEIYADDVKCTHGATIGQLDANSLFYLRSRGFDETAARRMLLHAFAKECLDRVAQPAIRAFLESLIQHRLLDVALQTPSSSQRILNRQDGHTAEEA